jgi:hypothetical protein
MHPSLERLKGQLERLKEALRKDAVAHGVLPVPPFGGAIRPGTIMSMMPPGATVDMRSLTSWVDMRSLTSWQAEMLRKMAEAETKIMAVDMGVTPQELPRSDEKTRIANKTLAEYYYGTQPRFPSIIPATIPVSVPSPDNVSPATWTKILDRLDSIENRLTGIEEELQEQRRLLLDLDRSFDEPDEEDQE